MKMTIRLLVATLLMHHGVVAQAQTTLQAITMDVRLEATFGTLLFCDTDTSNVVREATRTCLVMCEGLVGFHTAECIRGELAPASIFGGTKDEIRLFGDILGSPDVISSTSSCLREQISSPSCVAAVQSTLPNVAGLEYTGGLDDRRTQEPTATPAVQEPVSSPPPQALSPTLSPVVELPAAPSQFPSVTVLTEPTFAPPTITLTRVPTLAPVPLPAIVTRPPVVRRTPAPSWMFIRSPTTAPPSVSEPQLAIPTQQSRPSEVPRNTLIPSELQQPTASPTEQPSIFDGVSRPSEVPGSVLIPSEVQQPTASPTQQPSMFDEAGSSMNLWQPTASPTASPTKLAEETSSLFGEGNNESAIPIIISFLAGLLVMTSCILFFFGLIACCKSQKKRRRATAKRLQRRRWDAENVKIEHTLPLTRSAKSKRVEVSETEIDGLSSVSSFHPSDYSSSSGDGIDDDDDDRWAMYSVISGVSSAGVSRVSFSCNNMKKQISTRYEGHSF